MNGRLLEVINWFRIEMIPNSTVYAISDLSAGTFSKFSHWRMKKQYRVKDEAIYQLICGEYKGFSKSTFLAKNKPMPFDFYGRSKSL